MAAVERRNVSTELGVTAVQEEEQGVNDWKVGGLIPVCMPYPCVNVRKDGGRGSS